MTHHVSYVESGNVDLMNIESRIAVTRTQGRESKGNGELLIKIWTRKIGVEFPHTAKILWKIMMPCLLQNS